MISCLTSLAKHIYVQKNGNGLKINKTANTSVELIKSLGLFWEMSMETWTRNALFLRRQEPREMAEQEVGILWMAYTLTCYLFTG